jgi:signal transduction histidine kinase
MIELSKIDAGKVEIKVSKFLLKDILKSTMTMFSEKALQHNIKLILKIEPDADIEMEADTAKLGQILFNLLSNAMKFTPDRGSVFVHAQQIPPTPLY